MQRIRTLSGILTLAVLLTLSGISMAHDDEHHDKVGESKGHQMKEGSDSKHSDSMGHEYREKGEHANEGSGGEHAGKEYEDDHHGEYKDDHHDRKSEGSGGMKKDHH